MNDIFHPLINVCREKYLQFGRDLRRLEAYMIDQMGMPRSTWDSIPKSWITSA